MAGWHMRLWRRVKVAPGLTINLSKSGPSLSVGPRGSKVTFGQRGVRQTLGLPGTGLYMSRQLSSTPVWGQETHAVSAPAVNAAPEPGTPVAAAAPHPFEVHYGMPLLAAAVIGLGLAGSGQPSTVAVGAAVLAFIAGIAYEALAAHHPLVAKLLAQVVVAIIAVASVVIGIVVILATATLGASMKTRRR